MILLEKNESKKINGKNSRKIALILIFFLVLLLGIIATFLLKFYSDKIAKININTNLTEPASYTLLVSYTAFTTQNVAIPVLNTPLEQIPDGLQPIEDELTISIKSYNLTQLLNSGTTYSTTTKFQNPQEFYMASSDKYYKEISSDFIINYFNTSENLVYEDFDNTYLNPLTKSFVEKLINDASTKLIVAQVLYPGIAQQLQKNVLLYKAVLYTLDNNNVSGKDLEEIQLSRYLAIPPSYLSKEKKAWFLLNSIFWDEAFSLPNQVLLLEGIDNLDLANNWESLNRLNNYFGELIYPNYIEDFRTFFVENLSSIQDKSELVKIDSKFVASDIKLAGSNLGEVSANRKDLWNWVLRSINEESFSAFSSKVQNDIQDITIQNFIYPNIDSAEVLGDATTNTYLLAPAFEYLNRVKFILGYEQELLKTSGIESEEIQNKVSDLKDDSSLILFLATKQFANETAADDAEALGNLVSKMGAIESQNSSGCCIARIKIISTNSAINYAVSLTTLPDVNTNLEALINPSSDHLILNSDSYITSVPNGAVRIPVLMYHHVADCSGCGINGAYYVSPSDFEKQMAYLVSQDYKTLSPDEFYNYVTSGTQPSQKSVLITFDDGVGDQYANAYPILKKYGLTATFFVTSGFNYISPDQAREMVQNGMYIQSHTAGHTNLTTISGGALWSETGGNKATIESITGQTVDAIAYPYCVANSEDIGVVIASGFRMGFSCDGLIDYYPGRVYTLSRIHIYGNFENFKKRLLGVRESPPEFSYLPY